MPLHDVDYSDSLLFRQIHCPRSAELVAKATLEYYSLQVNVSPCALPEGSARFQGQELLFLSPLIV
jgi:hypothetical protein